MAPFYGSVQGSQGEVTRLGTNQSGIQTVAASWEGGVSTRLYKREDGEVWARVSLIPWGRSRAGTSQLLYDGPVGGQDES
jgi:hypothetical protein